MDFLASACAAVAMTNNKLMCSSWQSIPAEGGDAEGERERHIPAEETLICQRDIHIAAPIFKISEWVAFLKEEWGCVL